MTQLIVVALLVGVGLTAVVASYRLIRSDGGGPRRTPLPAEPSEGNTILPHPRGRRSQDGTGADVLEERRGARELRRAQYSGGRVNV